jgi:tRNA(adenine34) deaminase
MSTDESNVLGHEYFMGKALQLAQQAFDEDEIPIGALVVHQNRIIGKGYNQTERLVDVTAHAEMLAITSAAQFLGSKFLDECTIYITVEPCVMCAGAIQWARFKQVVFGLSEPKSGFERLALAEQVFGKKVEVLRGVMAEESRQLMQKFFKAKRS